MERVYFFDNIKAIATFLFVITHICIPYIPWTNWYYVPSNPDEYLPGIWRLMFLEGSFVMGLFFFISGYFMPISYENNIGMFVKKKIIRLLIPFIVGSGLFYIINGFVAVAHLWYIELLICFSMLYIFSKLLVARLKEYIPSNRFQIKMNINLLFICALLVSGFSVLVRMRYPIEHFTSIKKFIFFEPAHFPHYIVMFVLGICASNFNWLKNMSESFFKKVTLIGGILLFTALVFPLDSWRSFIYSYQFTIFESFLCVYIIFAIICLGYKCFNKKIAFLNWCAKQSYGVYLVHFYVILYLQYKMDSRSINVLSKVIIVSIVTIVFSFVSVYLLRKIPVVKKVI